MILGQRGGVELRLMPVVGMTVYVRLIPRLTSAAVPAA
jgi:hypothetical protein